MRIMFGLLQFSRGNSKDANRETEWEGETRSLRRKNRFILFVKRMKSK